MYSAGTRHRESGGEGLFEVVQHAVAEWTTHSESNRSQTVDHLLKGHISRYVKNTPYRSYSDRIQVTTRQHDCNIVINDEIGIKIIYNLHKRSREVIHKQLSILVHDYDYLLLYGHQIRPKHTDLWRHIVRSLSRYSDDTAPIVTFVTIQGGYYRIPVANTVIAKTIARKLGLFFVLYVAVMTSAYMIESATDGTVLGPAFVGALVVYNLIVIGFVIFLVKWL